MFQDTLPQNGASWHLAFCKEKEFEKWHVQEGLSDLPHYIRMKGASLSLKIKGHREESEGTGFAVSPFTTLIS